MGVIQIAGKPLVDGIASGRALVTDTPLSFWGGVDPNTGEVIDRRHPLVGASISGRILVLPSGRGSCTASAVLLEAIANGTAPAGIVVSEVDPILGLGAILGDELLGKVVPVVLVDEEERVQIGTGATISIREGGLVEIGD